MAAAMMVHFDGNSVTVRRPLNSHTFADAVGVGGGGGGTGGLPLSVCGTAAVGRTRGGCGNTPL